MKDLIGLTIRLAPVCLVHPLRPGEQIFDTSTYPVLMVLGIQPRDILALAREVLVPADPHAHGRYEQLHVENDVLVYRMTGENDAITIVLNVGDAAAAFTPEPGERLLAGGTGPHEAAVFGRA